MDTFNKALQYIFEAEGGRVNNASDPGGDTNFGISQREYPDLDIANLTREDAAAIYYRDYWTACRCDELPAAFAIVVFGSAVNHGVSRAIKLLQETLTVTVDGSIGPHTIAAANAQNNDYMLGRFFSFRALFYSDLATRKPAERQFLRGWLRRLFVLQQFVLETTRAA